MELLKTAAFPKGHIYHSDLMTTSLREAVPAIQAMDFRYLLSEAGYVKSIIPLNEFSSNQHGTHQGLLLAMGGDYTGGLALATILEDEPILGVHEIKPENAMSLWLLGSNMEYLSPSTEDVYLEAYIDPSLHAELKQRYFTGGTIVLDVEVQYKTEGNKAVAKGVFKYYCKKKNSLSVVTPGKRINAMFEHILKTSAKLIARLRATEAEQDKPLFIDPISSLVAGRQGKVIADRFVKSMPELQHMVAARTHHLDCTLAAYAPQISQLVFVGAGLDFRTYRLNNLLGHKTIFELDLKEMLDERAFLEEKYRIKPAYGTDPIRVACNFLTDSIVEKLLSVGFDAKLPTFFIYEGCAMYFTYEENKQILTQLQQLIQANNNSLLWMDKVDEAALNKTISSPSLQFFLSNMAKLGEPFIFGFDAGNSLLHEVNLQIIESAITTQLKDLPHSDIYPLYSFNVLTSKA